MVCLNRPTRFMVEYEDPAEVAKVEARFAILAAQQGCSVQAVWETSDPMIAYRERDFTELDAALAFARQWHGELYERVDIRDEASGPDAAWYHDWAFDLRHLAGQCGGYDGPLDLAGD